MSQKRIISEETLIRVVKNVMNIDKREKIKIDSWDMSTLKSGTVGEVYMVQGSYHYLNGESKNKFHWNVILKIQKKWIRIGDPESWKRELLMYQNNIFDNMPNNFRVPKCYDVIRENNEVWLWMEKLKGNNHTDIDIDDYEIIAKQIGEFQGKLYENKEIIQPWMSSKYWYSVVFTNWAEAVSFLDDEENNPDERELDKNTRKSLYDTWLNRDVFLDIMSKLPETLCHRDFHPGNIFIDKEEGKENNITLIDWDSTGLGVLGEDIADLLGETLMFYQFDLNKAGNLMDMIFSNYIDGLRATNCNVKEELVRLGYVMCFVIHWGFRTCLMLKYAEDIEDKERYINMLKFIAKKKELLEVLIKYCI